MLASATRLGSISASSHPISAVALPRTPTPTSSHTALARTTASSGTFTFAVCSGSPARTMASFGTSAHAPAPTFGPHKAGTYVNGAISPFTAGELAKGAFGCGYEAYGWDILQRFMKMVEKDGAVYFLYNPKGGNSTTAYLGPSAWGAAALLSAVDEGLAGIVNAGFGYDEIAFSPRWPVTPYRELRYFTGYESAGRYVDCRYVQTEEGFRYHLRSPAKKIRAHLLVPSGKTPKSLRVNGTETPFALATVGGSRYVDVAVYVDAVVTLRGGAVDFEVVY